MKRKQTTSTRNPTKKRGKRNNSIEEAIRLRAYEIYCNRGQQSGHELDDWLQAESELRAK